ncbi:hypothetical protein KO489_07070 [Reinekea forsetii]|nr:hypothetical protein [Reinekea forsetii]
MKRHYTSQQGVALVAAIFLIVVLGLAVVVMSVLATRNSQQNTQSLLQMRAIAAASAALEHGAQNIVETGTCTSGTGITLTALPGFSVNLRCSQSAHNRPSQRITLFRLTASAEYGSPNNADYVWTELASTIEL